MPRSFKPLLFSALAAGLAAPAMAQEPGATYGAPIETALLEPIPAYSEGAAYEARLSPDQPLSWRDGTGARLSRGWIEGAPQARSGRGGAVVYRYGEALPVLICAPLKICDIALERGETVRDVLLGDTERWDVQPATSGPEGASVTHVVVKPLDAGLETSLLVTTDRRAYAIKLISRQGEWMPHIAFSYPGAAQSAAAWADYRERADASETERRAREAALAQVAALRAEREARLRPAIHRGGAGSALDFRFAVSGDAPWRPARVFHDGTRTTIEMPPGFHAQEAPALVVLDAGGAPRLVNYRLSGGRYVVDGLFREAALIAGVGADRQTVTIRRTAR